MRKTIEDLGILQIGANRIFATKRVGEDFMGQLFSQP